MNNEIKVMNNDEIRDFCIKKDLKIFELEQELKQKDNIIKEVREYIEEKYDYILGDDTFLDHDERIERKQIDHILEILDKEAIKSE